MGNELLSRNANIRFSFIKTIREKIHMFLLKLT